MRIGRRADRQARSGEGSAGEQPALQERAAVDSPMLFGSMPSMRALILGAAVAVGLGLAAHPAVAAQTGPTCAPATLDNSALQDGSVTVSPLPGSRDASP